MTQAHNDGRAAEYVLGTLDADERREFADVLAHNPELQNLVEEWQQRLQGLEPGITEVEPSADLWHKIEAALDAGGAALPGSTTLRGDDGEWQQLIASFQKDPPAEIELSNLLQELP